MRPCISNEILQHMYERDELHKHFTKEKDETRRNYIFKFYKIKRNNIITELRKNKKDYYVVFFKENKSNIKETWEGISDIVNISKKQNIVPSKILYQKLVADNKVDIAENFNNFFVNITHALLFLKPLQILLNLSIL